MKGISFIVVAMLLTTLIFNGIRITIDIEKSHTEKLVVLETMQRHQRTLSAMDSSIRKEFSIPGPEARYHAWLFDDFVLQNAIRYDVCIPWELFAATFWCESRLTTHAMSPMGAKGKAQTLDESFKLSCARMNNPSSEVSIWNDWLNMSAGAEILSKAYAKGGYEYAIKAYVGGEKFVDCIEIRRYFTLVDSTFKHLAKTYKEIYGTIK